MWHSTETRVGARVSAGFQKILLNQARGTDIGTYASPLVCRITKRQKLTQRVTARELGLLRVVPLKDIANVVQKLDIALLGVGLESRDEGMGHGTRSLRVDSGIGRGVVALEGTLCETEYAGGHGRHVATGIRTHRRQQARAGFLGQVGLLEKTLGVVDIGKIKYRARVARVENGRQPDTFDQGLHNVEVDLVVHNMAVLLEVDRVNNLIVSILLVAIMVLGLTAVA
ncbi:hypothetical protein QC764_0000380 [Podospora pseudoanserina]|uniref:Uncharacterized protein n=1 Tax=Podospora pseudoanserina TaxID=2609844 RepID=A0ABR0IK98_9PEZI|nr:hypothetical protein QC764_0000380 [Podospora pseudoanserina]